MQYQNYSNENNWLWILVLIGILAITFNLVSFLIGLFITFFPFLILIYVIKRAFRISTIRQAVIHRTQDETRFVELLINILVLTFKADGRVDQREIAVTKAFFIQILNYNTQQMKWIEDLIQVALRDNHSLEEITEEFNRSFNYETKMIALQMVYRVIYADNEFTRSEKRFVDKLVGLLKLSEKDYERIRALFVKTEDEKSDHYNRLGLKKGASKEEIKKAYRSLVKEYHPDKVHHLGPEFQKVAQEKMRAINDAYEALTNG